MSIDKTGLILLVITSLGWSLSGVIIKTVEMDALPIAFYRSAIAGLFVGLWALRRGSNAIGMHNVYTAGAYCGAVILLVVSTKATTAANAIILQYAAPAFVFVLAVPLLDERPSRQDWWVLASTMVGVGCIFSQGMGGALAGIVYGLASGVGFALLTVLLRRYQHSDPLKTIAFNNMVVAVLLLPWVWDRLVLSPRDLLLMFIMGTVQLGGPYVLYAYALRRVVARDAALISLLEPLLNPVWVFLIVGEVPAATTFLGGAFIVGGLFLRFTRRSP